MLLLQYHYCPPEEKGSLLVAVLLFVPRHVDDVFDNIFLLDYVYYFT